MIPDRTTLVEHARDSIAKGSKSFAGASQLFDRTTRERAWLLYAWCRRCDDMADGQDHGGAMQAVDDASARLTTIRRLTAEALAGRETGDPAFDGFGLVAREGGIPERYAHDLIEGFALDAAGWSPADTDGLLRYCYHVAGAVGCMMAIVMGVAADNDAALDRACDLGLAFQLANIARDVIEDAQAGRCYLPAAWLDEKQIPRAAMADGAHRPALATLGARLAEMAAAYEDSARHGAAFLPARSAWAVLSAAGIYGDIAREVARRDLQAWDARIVTTGSDKLRWVVKAGWQVIRRARRWPTDTPRGALWTRPAMDSQENAATARSSL